VISDNASRPYVQVLNIDYSAVQIFVGFRFNILEVGLVP